MSQATRPRDVVYTGGRVLAEDGSRTIEAALWTRGDRIAAIGREEDLLRGAGPAAEVVPLEGAVILPGLSDPHSHISQVAYLLAGADCSQPGAPDIPSIQARLATTPPAADGWVIGSGFAEYKLAERRPPTRRELDEAVPDAPCVLYQVSLHTCVVNSAALRALGYDDATPDPAGGRLGRDGDGHLDGSLLEQPMFDLVSASQARLVELASPAERVASAERAGRHFASLGLTGCTDASIDTAGFAPLRLAEAAGRLPIRVTAMFWFEDAAWLLRAGMTTGFGSDRLRIGALKLFCDGGMSSRTAAVERPYAAPAGEMGVLLQAPEALAEQVRRCADAGFQVGIHAQGDRGIRVAIDALEAVSGAGNPMRNRIEHGGLFTWPLRERAGRIGLHCVSQPAFLSILGDGFLEAFGPGRAGDLYPFASLRDAGVLVAGSSDAPVVTAAPLLGIRDAILRRTAGGARIASAEAVTAVEAIAMYTSRAAFVEHRERDFGTLSAGRLADLTILDRDPLAAEPASIAEIRVLRTVVGGQTVFQADRAGVEPRMA